MRAYWKASHRPYHLFKHAKAVSNTVLRLYSQLRFTCTKGTHQKRLFTLGTTLSPP